MGLNIKKILQTAVGGGGGPSTQRKPLYPRLAEVVEVVVLTTVYIALAAAAAPQILTQPIKNQLTLLSIYDDLISSSAETIFVPPTRSQTNPPGYVSLVSIVSFQSAFSGLIIGGINCLQNNGPPTSLRHFTG